MALFDNTTYKVNSWARKNNFPPMLVWLIGINLAIFLVYNIVDKSLILFGSASGVPFRLLAMPTDFSRLLLAPWTLVTSIFFHEGVWHILFNMIWLWFFGRLFLQHNSARELLRVYLLGGITGNLLCMLAYAVFPYFHGAASISYILGASGAAMAVMLAITMQRPREKVYIWAMVGLELRYFAIIMVAIDLLSATGDNAGGHIAHIGGAAFGLLYGPAMRYFRGIRSKKRPHQRTHQTFSFKGKGSANRKRKQYANATSSSRNPASQHQEQDEKQLKAILDKLAKGGYGALTTEEKEFLFNHRR